MRLQQSVIILVISGTIAGVGVWQLTPWVFAGRNQPGIVLGEHALTGIPLAAIEGVVSQYEQELLNQPVQLRLRDKEVTRTLRELGVSIDKEATKAAIQAAQGQPLEVGERSIATSFMNDDSVNSELSKQEFSH